MQAQKNKFMWIPALGFWFLTALAAGGSADSPAGTPPLGLAVYLDQVKQGNSALVAARSNQQALNLAALEPETVFSPYLSADLNRLDNQAPNSNPLFMGSRTVSTRWSLELSKRWETGTFTALGDKGDWTRTDYPDSGIVIPGLGSITPSADPFYSPAPYLTVSQSLWRDFGAAGSRATVAKIQAAAQSARQMSAFKIHQIIFNAKQAYIQLALARASVRIQQDSLARNRKILEWSERRAASNLGDLVDVLQTRAAVKQVELGLAQAEQDLSNAARQFNLLRGRENQAEAEPLEEITVLETGLERKADRADLQAAVWDSRGKQAAVEETTHKYLPDFSLYATASLNGRDTDAGQAFSQSFTLEHPTTVVGVKFSTNLDLPLIGKALEGARLVSQAGDQDLRQKQIELEKDWSTLREQWDNARARLEIAGQLEKMQEEKAEREKTRFRNGRTTNYQVLRFEEDFAQAKLMKLRVLAECRLLAAQADWYNGRED